MDTHLAELAVVYEIASFNFSSSEEELFRELVAKATRLFGARRIVLMLFEESACPVCHVWGFPEHFLQEQGNLLDYVRQPDVARHLFGLCYLQVPRGPCIGRLLTKTWAARSFSGGAGRRCDRLFGLPY